MAKTRPGILVILDGFGINPSSQFNAIAQAKTPNLDRLMKKYAHGELEASEGYVGLPSGFMGNSEVGHLNIGAGRVVYQDFSLISKAIEDESFFNNPVFVDLITKIKAQPSRKALHIVGLVSDGGVHSHVSHLYALLQLAKRKGLENIWIHVITDGRDTPPTSGTEHLRRVSAFCADSGVGKCATVMGRFYAMDRDNRWERTQRAYETMVGGTDAVVFDSPLSYIEANYQERVTDEFIPPGRSSSYQGIQDGDGIIFFNFRADRARQLTRAFTQSDFSAFPRSRVPKLSGFVCMTPYDDSFGLPAAFGKPRVPDTLGEIVSRQGWKQLRVAETEKYAHVTYFFNGGDERVFEGEKRILVPSPRDVRTYDLKPEMNAQEVTDSLLQELKQNDYPFAVVNFANCDMVGHTGNLGAAIKAVEAVDRCLGEITDWVESKSAFAVITADHGNCEKMLDDNGEPLTAHTTLPVPFILIDDERKNVEIRTGGRLCDIAPTFLSIWGIKQPPEMTGQSLISE